MVWKMVTFNPQNLVRSPPADQTVRSHRKGTVVRPNDYISRPVSGIRVRGIPFQDSEDTNGREIYIKNDHTRNGNVLRWQIRGA